ncbi:MAG TPA: hypothetical protein VD995_03175 [Azospirillum sp.]|nr:hypothetical protein [Azospirillum sp.]
MTAAAPTLTVEPIGGSGILVILVAGLPGHQEAEVAFLIDAGRVRTLNAARGLSVPRLERPLAPGLPSIAAILRGAVQPQEDAS